MGGWSAATAAKFWMSRLCRVASQDDAVATGPALGRGIVSGFGIDTICSAGNDLFSEMRLALAAERSRANAPALASGKQVPAVDLHQRDMLRPATIDGARVWHLEDQIGTLTPAIMSAMPWN
jgi:5-methylthioadenosine/S-adenosylhomocysteine deaminase